MRVCLPNQVREEEMEELEALLDQAPLNVKGGLASKEGKTCVLMQAYIGGLPVKAFALVSDCTFIAQSAARIARGLFEITLARGWLSYAEKVLVASDWCRLPRFGCDCFRWCLRLLLGSLDCLLIEG
jgi:hypothetical protein